MQEVCQLASVPLPLFFTDALSVFVCQGDSVICPKITLRNLHIEDFDDLLGVSLVKQGFLMNYLASSWHPRGKGVRFHWFNLL